MSAVAKRVFILDGAVQQRHLDVDERVARYDAAFERALDALAYCRDELLRDTLPPRVASTNWKPAPRSRGATARVTTANCPGPPSCFTCR